MAITVIPGAYPDTNIDDRVITLLDYRLVEMMYMIDPNIYRNFVIIDRKGEIMMYEKIQKAIYGLLRIALLFYKILIEKIKENGLF